MEEKNYPGFLANNPVLGCKFAGIGDFFCSCVRGLNTNLPNERLLLEKRSTSKERTSKNKEGSDLITIMLLLIPSSLFLMFCFLCFVFLQKKLLQPWPCFFKFVYLYTFSTAGESTYERDKLALSGQNSPTDMNLLREIARTQSPGVFFFFCHKTVPLTSGLVW